MSTEQRTPSPVSSREQPFVGLNEQLAKSYLLECSQPPSSLAPPSSPSPSLPIDTSFSHVTSLPQTETIQEPFDTDNTPHPINLINRERIISRISHPDILRMIFLQLDLHDRPPLMRVSWNCYNIMAPILYREIIIDLCQNPNVLEGIGIDINTCDDQDSRQTQARNLKKALLGHAVDVILLSHLPDDCKTGAQHLRSVPLALIQSVTHRESDDPLDWPDPACDLLKAFNPTIQNVDLAYDFRGGCEQLLSNICPTTTRLIIALPAYEFEHGNWVSDDLPKLPVHIRQLIIFVGGGALGWSKPARIEHLAGYLCDLCVKTSCPVQIWGAEDIQLTASDHKEPHVRTIKGITLIGHGSRPATLSELVLLTFRYIKSALRREARQEGESDRITFSPRNENVEEKRTLRERWTLCNV